MKFSPTWIDYFILALFTSLFLLTGWLTNQVLWAQRGNPAAVKSSEPFKGTFADVGYLSFSEWVLLILINALVVTSFVLLLTAQLGFFRFRFWLFLLTAYDISILIYLKRWRRVPLKVPIPDNVSRPSDNPSPSLKAALSQETRRVLGERKVRTNSPTELAEFPGRGRKRISFTLPSPFGREAGGEGDAPATRPFHGTRWHHSRLHWIALGWPRLGKSELLVLPLCLVALFTFNRPSEFITANRDPGEYVNIAVNISETGSLKFRDTDFQEFHSKENQELFLPVPLPLAPYPEVLPGFYLIDPVSGEMLPQYFHLFPLWLALAFKLWRFQGIFGLNIFLGVLSVLMLIPLARRLFHSQTVGLLSAFLLAINLGQIWIIRSPFSEILAQVLLLAGIWVLSLGVTENLKGLCFWAGLLFGLTLFVRIDSFLVLAALIFFSAFMLLASGKQLISFPIIPFLAALGFSVVYILVHVSVFAYPYLFNVITTVRSSSPSWNSRVAIVCLVTLMILGLWKKASPDKLSWVREQLQKKLLPVLFGLVTAFFIYGYFLRPYQNPGNHTIPLPSPHVGSVRLYDEINLVRLGWYLSPLGLGLAYLGSLISLRRMVRGETILLPFLLILGIFSGFYLYKSRAFPDNYWVIRRYTEIVIPGFLMLASLAIDSLFRLSSKYLPPRASLATSACIFVFLAGWQLKTSSLLLNKTELKNTLQQIESLASMNRYADVLLLEAGPFQDFVSSPLKFIFHKTVYPLAHFKPNVQAFEKMMDEWRQQGKQVHILASGEHTELDSSKYRFAPEGRFEFRTKVVEPTYDRMPQAMEDLRFSVQIYEVQRKVPGRSLNAITFNMGDNFGFRTTGLYRTELNSDGETFRWSEGSSTLELPPIDSSHDAILFLRLGQDVPAGVILPSVQVFFNAALIAEAKLSSRFEIIRRLVPKSMLNVGGKNKIEFSSSTFCPSQVGGSQDKRELGFMLDCIKLQSTAPIAHNNPYFVDFGADSDVVDGELLGFYGREGGSYRWTGKIAHFILPIPLAPDQEHEILLRAVKSCPKVDFRQFLALSLNGLEIGEVELLGTGDEFKIYRFRVPQRIPFSQNPNITIRVAPTWNPRSAGYSEDWRTLGCAIDWLKID